MATISARKGKKRTTYQAIVRKRGYKTASKTFTRKSDAKTWARNTETEMERGEYGVLQESSRRTLADLIDHYLEVEASPTTRESALNWWREEIGHKKLSQITPALLSKKKEVLKSGSDSKRTKRRSGSTVNRYLAYLSAVYKRAVQEYQWVNDNPVRKVAKEREPRGRTRFLSERERTSLLGVCLEQDAMLYELVVVALTTGARAGELATLDWKDIDFRRGVAYLHNTKNRESRTIPIGGRAAELLKARRGLGRVFTAPSGAPYDYSKSFRAALESAKIEDFRFHDLRHTAAALMAQNGLTLLEIAHVLGHKSIQMTQRYAHLCTETVTKAGVLLDEKVFPQ